MLNIPTELLRTLVAVVDLRSFTKAAQVLGVTQPAVSAQIKRLQFLLGFEILDKSAPGVSLTSRGEMVVGHARRMLAINDQIAQLSGTRPTAQTLRVGIPGDFAGVKIPATLAQFRKRWPDIRFTASATSFENMLRGLRQGDFDLCVAIANRKPAFEAHHLWIDEAVWVRSDATQLDDLRKTRRDLLTVVKEVDDRVQEVFASAYADTAREFEHLFSRLFPGGQGNLVLTEPDDMLATGIEIEARPPGKKVKRLSLLSGGERSLTAIAYLFAIFKARPSPFYVLDEVEAALDDTNLQRLLLVFDELRESSQLIIITHQRRTMESADALYGITMRGDGVSAVISQQIAARQPA